MQLVQRWWNGLFGRLARRDIWLEQDTVWRVRVRQGNGDSPTRSWTFDDRYEADAFVKRLLAADSPGKWRDIASISATDSRRQPTSPIKPPPRRSGPSTGQ